MTTRFIFFWVLISSTYLVKSQNAPLDDLFARLEKAADDSTKAHTLYFISFQYLRVDLDSAIYYGKKCLEHGKESTTVPVSKNSTLAISTMKWADLRRA